MSTEINYTSNPLNGVGLKKLLTEIADHYGFEILFAYLNINCFKTNPSIDSSVKFLKKTAWAREKVEAFYLYEFKNLPKASSAQSLLTPRERIVPDDQRPGEPAELSFEDAERLRQQREKSAAEWDKGAGRHPGSSKRFNAKRSAPANNRDKQRAPKPGPESSHSPDATVESKIDPWANWKSKSEG